VIAAQQTEAVLAAMTAGMVTPDGTALTTTVAPLAGGATRVGYLREDREVAHRTFRVAGPVVWLDGFAVVKYHNGRGLATALHERFLANLGAGADSYVLRATLSDVSARAWVRHYDWASDMASATAATLRTAVEALDGLLRTQSVWDAEGLAGRVLDLGGGTGWREVVESTTPASLYAGLESIRAGLGNAVFLSIGTWHGSRTVTGTAVELEACA
jgi:hypothetical protein